MIIKNEKNTIEKTLNSCINIINKAYICDTGSTDNTIELVNKYKQKFDLEVMTNKFIDFSTNRNYVLEKIKKNESFDTIVLMLDANDEIINGNDLINFINKFPNYDMYNVSHEWQGDDHTQKFIFNRIIKNNGKFHFKNSVHEELYPVNINCDIKASPLVPNFLIYQNRNCDINDTGEHSSTLRTNEDFNILMDMHKKIPKDTRILYHLCRTSFFLKKYDLCKNFCSDIFTENSQDEYTYQSLYLFAKCMMCLNEQWDDIEKYLYKAYEFTTQLQKQNTQVTIINIEPLIPICIKYLNDNCYIEAYVIAKKICLADIPFTLLPIDITVYNFIRWKLLALACDTQNDFQLGLFACNFALASNEASNVFKYYKLSKLKPYEADLIKTVAILHKLRNKFENSL